MSDEIQMQSDELAKRIETLKHKKQNVIDEAKSYHEIISLSDLTQEKLAKQLQCSQATIANKLRLLRLGDAAKSAIQEGKITERHGRTLLKLDKRKQASMVNRILKKNLTVKETEKIVKEIVNTQLDVVTQKTILNDFLKQGLSRLAKRGVFVEETEFENKFVLTIVDRANQK